MRDALRTARRLDNTVCRARALGCGLACVVFLAGMVGCQAEHHAQLLSVEGVESSEIAAGDTLRVRGRGYVAGQPCRVRLRGTLWRVGQHPTQVDVSFAARATSSDVVEAVLAARLLPQLDGHATFEGELTVGFSAVHGDTQVSGTTVVNLDLTDAEPELAQRHARRQEAEQTLATLGLSVDEGGDGGDGDIGLRVRSVRAGSLAANADLQPGDNLTHLGGLRLRAVSDLVTTPAARELGLRVRTGATGGVRDVRLALVPASERRMLGAEGLVLAAVLLLLCLAWALPRPFRVVNFSTVSESQLPAAGNGASTIRDTLRAVVLWPLVSAATWVLLFVAQQRGVSLHLMGFAAALVAMHLAVTTAGLRGRGLWAVAARQSIEVCWVLLPLACAGLVGGSLTLGGLVERQGVLPWRWFSLSVPPLWLCAVSFVLASRRLMTTWHAVHPDLSRVLAVALGGVGAATYLGGWQAFSPTARPGVMTAAVLGLLLFASKAWWLSLVLTMRARWLAPVSMRVVAAMSLTGTGLSVAWLTFEPSATLSLLLGYACVLSTLLWWAVRTWRVQRASAWSVHY